MFVRYFVTDSSVEATTKRSFSKGLMYALEAGAREMLLKVRAASFVIFSEFLSAVISAVDLLDC